MTQVLLVKNNNALYAADEVAERYLSRIAQGEAVEVKVRKYRNLAFHRKFFALLNYAYDMWEPPEVEPEKGWMKAMTPEKSFDRFRKDLIILAGYYEPHYRVNGEVRLEAKSIAFDKMDEDEFAELYSAVLDVILDKICVGYNADQLTNEIMEFA